MARWLAVIGLGLVCMATGCSSPVQAAGAYSVNVTNGDNGCMLSNFNAGAMTSNIPITITQNDDQVTAVVGGLAGAALTLALGSSTFQGKVDGPSLSLTLYGTRAATQNSCTYTYNANIDATLSGDLLEGAIKYVRANNGNPGCVDCSKNPSVQQFNGTRPPT